MKNVLLCSALVLVGCGPKAATYVRSPETTLGRVVVYRNGVAYFERVAQVQGDSLKLQVPADKVDDFLKSLTVVDARTGDPAPIAYPTSGPSSTNGLIDMKIQLTGNAPHSLRLSYVTEAPSWKPSYRLVVAKSGKVSMQGWAVVDNTSGEDWTGVKLGVGSSSALSFRYDLRSVRLVERETLHSNDLFALAPPMGGATYGKEDGRIVSELDDQAIAPAFAPGQPGKGVPAPDAASQGAGISSMAQALKVNPNQIFIEGYAAAGDKDKYSASLGRANRVRDELIRNGVDASKIVAVGRGEQAGHGGGVRVVETPVAKAPESKPEATNPAPRDPIGTSHFESQTAMSVPRGTSAMVSILSADTDGEIVYLYDAESSRGDARFPFRAVRMRNPTDSVLESGPVTVFGEGKFIGEGLSEPIPARSIAFVPFALDRQIVVETKDGERDEISRILTVQRGVFSTEVQHTRKKTMTFHNRTGERATVYARHTVAPGYTLAKSVGIPCSEKGCEKIGGAHLFRIDVEPHGTTELLVEEHTPVWKSTDIRTPGGLDMVRVFLASSPPSAFLKDKVGELVKLHGEMAKIDQQISTMREQMQEYRVRMDELHAQLVTLKAVRTAGPLMASLERKMQEMSDKLSKTTIDLVNLQEKHMLARVRFQDGVSELSLEKTQQAP